MAMFPPRCTCSAGDCHLTGSQGGPAPLAHPGGICKDGLQGQNHPSQGPPADEALRLSAQICPSSYL
eukprot:scaffold102236_cov24-Prasinocladus_malaysianus.AAC.1